MPPFSAPPLAPLKEACRGPLGLHTRQSRIHTQDPHGSSKAEAEDSSSSWGGCWDCLGDSPAMLTPTYMALGLQCTQGFDSSLSHCAEHDPSARRGQTFTGISASPKGNAEPFCQSQHFPACIIA